MPVTIKTVKEKKYLYFNYYKTDEKKKVEKYCGPAGDPESMRRAKAFEKQHLKEQIGYFQAKVEEIESLELKKPVGKRKE